MEKPINSSSIPPALTFYRGGLNVGVFYPAPPAPRGSEVFGNPFTGNPFTYRTQAFDPGEKTYGWVLILSKDDSKIATRTIDQRKTDETFSDYDGQYNKNKLTTVGKQVMSIYKKGNYMDWYVPSRDELAFICKNLPKDFSLDFRFSPMTDKYVTSSYLKNDPKKQNILFAQSFRSNTYGVTSYVSDLELMSVRYVRRVPVILT